MRPGVVDENDCKSNALVTPARSGQPSLRTHYETLSVAAMRVRITISQVTPRTNRHKIAKNQRDPKVILPLITQRQKQFSYQLIGPVKLL
jgi:hypothetical protein